MRGLCAVATSLIYGTTKSLSPLPPSLLRLSPSHFLREPSSLSIFITCFCTALDLLWAY